MTAVYIREAHTERWPLGNFTLNTATCHEQCVERAKNLRSDISWLFDSNNLAASFGAWPEMLIILHGYRLIRMVRTNMIAELDEL